MKKYSCISLRLFTATLLITSCGNTREKNNQNVQVKIDTVSSASAASADTFEEGDDLKQIFQSYISMYMDTVCIDTTVKISGSEAQISFRHYCTLDSAVKIAKRYTQLYDIKDFVTHNFESSLKVKIDNDLVLDTIIKKKNYEKNMPDYIQENAVLLYPNLHVDSGVINIQYGLSIPLTDVGEPVNFIYKIDRAKAVKS